MTAPKVMDGYVRVSRRLGREGPGYISPRVQREAIQRWADYKGVTIAEWHVDEDESGGTQDRPGLIAAVERAVGGETGGIVSWKIDRFSRFTEGGLRDLRRLEAAGSRLAFVTEDIDTSGPMGKFVYTVMLAMSEYVLDNIKAGWRDAKARAVERGAHIGPTPYGYQRRADGTLEADPDRGPVVTEAFAVAARDGLPACISFLLEHASARTWTAFTTRRFLSTRTYLGHVGYGDLVAEDAHDALVTRVIFEAAKRAAGEGGKRRRRADAFPLSGVGTCGSCDGRLVGGRGGNDHRRVYRCAARCAAPVVISADLLEAHVVTELRGAFDHPGFQVGETSSAADEAVTVVEEAERRLDEFASDLTARELLGHRYHHHLEQRVTAVREAGERLQDALASAAPARVIVPDELWDDLAPAELAEVLSGGLEAVIVSRGHRPVRERVRIVPKGMHGGSVPGAQDASERGLEP